jgi:hypothetical protein
MSQIESFPKPLTRRSYRILNWPPPCSFPVAFNYGQGTWWGNLIEQTAKDVGILMLIMLQIVYTQVKKLRIYSMALYVLPSGGWCKNIIISISSVPAQTTINIQVLMYDATVWRSGVNIGVERMELGWVSSRVCMQNYVESIKRVRCTYAKFSHTHKIRNLTFMSCLEERVRS